MIVVSALKEAAFIWYFYFDTATKWTFTCLNLTLCCSIIINIWYQCPLLNPYASGGLFGQYQNYAKNWKNYWNPAILVLIWEFSARAFQWIPTWQGLGGFQKSLPPCAVDESNLSIWIVMDGYWYDSFYCPVRQGWPVGGIDIIFLLWYCNKINIYLFKSTMKNVLDKIYFRFKKVSRLWLSVREYQSHENIFFLKENFLSIIWRIQNMHFYDHFDTVGKINLLNAEEICHSIQYKGYMLYE